MKLAIFGNKGYLGSQLEFWFSSRNHEISGFDKPDCDVSEADFWQTFDPARFDAILFFSGLTGTERSFDEAETFLLVNELGLLRLLRKLSPLGKSAPKVIFPSTRLVYKGNDIPLREDAEKDPKTPYAVNKLACEGYLSAYGNRYGIPYAVLRICVPYGSLVPSDRSYGTIGFFERQASQSKKISLFGGGDTKRTFTDIHQICQSVETLLSHGSGVFNVGGTSMSLREAAQSIAFRHGAVVVSVPWPDIDLRLESGHTVFDGSRLESLMEASNGKS